MLRLGVLLTIILTTCNVIAAEISDKLQTRYGTLTMVKENGVAKGVFLDGRQILQSHDDISRILGYGSLGSEDVVLIGQTCSGTICQETVFQAALVIIAPNKTFRAIGGFEFIKEFGPIKQLKAVGNKLVFTGDEYAGKTTTYTFDGASVIGTPSVKVGRVDDDTCASLYRTLDRCYQSCVRLDDEVFGGRRPTPFSGAEIRSIRYGFTDSRVNQDAFKHLCSGSCGKPVSAKLDYKAFGKAVCGGS